MARCARAAHNVLVTYCRSAGDHSIKEWDDAQQQQRDDTMKLVRSYVEQGSTSTSAEHDRWAADKRARGYVWGSVKNDDPGLGPLTNPNLVPWAQLPVYARGKDALLLVVVAGMASHYGLMVKKELSLSFAG